MATTNRQRIGWVAMAEAHVAVYQFAAAQIVDHEALEADDDEDDISATTSNVSKKRADSSSGRSTNENARRLIKSAGVLLP